MTDGLASTLLVELLDRKHELDHQASLANNMVSYDAWLRDAVALLLQVELIKEVELEARHERQTH